ncbi:MAG: ParM/StbA family protein [Gammaproteobacteria bacterium]|jgi:plasmid segregation protein ParM|nr:ParM/StbA family protein [Gammaproteobacteria bacterium]
MVIVGLDVGYSNLKLAVGEIGGPPRLIVRPAGAAPVDRVGERVGSGAGGPEAIRVEVGGRGWAAAIEPVRFEGWQRSLHEDYSATPAYHALVQAALVLAERPVVDRLVTGLPVAHARDPRRRDALRRLLLGHHRTARGAVDVREVRILPQPVGAYVDLLWGDLGSEDLERIEAGTVLVLDVGYFSVDWGVIVHGELRRDASGTSLEAMSVVLEKTAERIARVHGGRPQPLAVEAALREGREHLRVLGARVPLAPVLAGVAEEIAGVSLEALRQALRREATNVDLVLLTGGGGALYGPQVAELFPGAEVRLAPEPVAANARGFFHYGGQ